MRVYVIARLSKRRFFCAVEGSRRDTLNTSRESSFPVEEALQLPSAGEEDPAPSFKYAVYRQMVTHATDVEGYSFHQQERH